MVREYDLQKYSLPFSKKKGEMLRVDIFRNGENFPCIVIQCPPDLKSIHIDKLDSVNISELNDELYRLFQFLSGRHWRDYVKRGQDAKLTDLF